MVLAQENQPNSDEDLFSRVMSVATPATIFIVSTFLVVDLGAAHVPAAWLTVAIGTALAYVSGRY